MLSSHWGCCYLFARYLLVFRLGTLASLWIETTYISRALDSRLNRSSRSCVLGMRVVENMRPLRSCKGGSP